MQCDVIFYKIYWYLEGKLSKEFKSLQLRNNSFTVDYVTDADEGYYMCTAVNGIGAGLKKIIHINVNGKYGNLYFYFILQTIDFK